MIELRSSSERSTAPPADQAGGTTVTKASLQADPANAHERTRQLTAEVHQLEKRLSEALGGQCQCSTIGLGSVRPDGHAQ